MSSDACLRGPESPYERDGSIADVFDAVARHRPEGTAVRDEHGTMTYAELEATSNRFACYLASCGVTSGVLVGVGLERSRILPVVLLAILKAGAAYVPLDPTYPQERLAFTAADSGISLVIAREGLVRSALRQLPFIDPDDAKTTVDAWPNERPLVRIAADDLAYVMYTSGSTGRPKGVEIMHRGVLRLVRGTNYVEIEPSDVFFQFAPLAFDASTFEFWGALLNGATLAIPPARALALSDIAAWLHRFEVSVLWLTAPLFGLMVRSELVRFGGLRYLLTGGDVVSSDDARAFLREHPQCRLIDGYGPTENTTFSCTFAIPSADAIEATIPIGTPIANSSAYVLDEARRPVAMGTVGELYVGGDGVGRGYRNLPELTAERFLLDPFSNVPGSRMYRTGDRARLRRDGTLEFLGRTDDQVKIRGFRIELGEIEHALRANPAVLEAAVSVVSDGAGEKTLYAHVVAVAGTMLDVTVVRRNLEQRLPRHMIPHRINLVSGLAKNASGKFDRGELATSARHAAPVVAVNLRNARRQLEREISACWDEILGERAGDDVDLNFFDAGGDSLRLLALHERLVAKLGVQIDVLDLFTYVTIRSLAESLVARRAL